MVISKEAVLGKMLIEPFFLAIDYKGNKDDSTLWMWYVLAVNVWSTGNMVCNLAVSLEIMIG